MQLDGEEVSWFWSYGITRRAKTSFAWVELRFCRNKIFLRTNADERESAGPSIPDAKSIARELAATFPPKSVTFRIDDMSGVVSFAFLRVIRGLHFKSPPAWV
jgi:hypothetical protein